jgi:hypothetical protein
VAVCSLKIRHVPVVIHNPSLYKMNKNSELKSAEREDDEGEKTK